MGLVAAFPLRGARTGGGGPVREPDRPGQPILDIVAELVVLDELVGAPPSRSGCCRLLPSVQDQRCEDCHRRATPLRSPCRRATRLSRRDLLLARASPCPRFSLPAFTPSQDAADLRFLFCHDRPSEPPCASGGGPAALSVVAFPTGSIATTLTGLDELLSHLASVVVGAVSDRAAGAVLNAQLRGGESVCPRCGQCRRGCTAVIEVICVAGD
jgi:hypothetical protein